MNREDANTVKTPMPRGYRPSTDEEHTATVRIDPDALLFALEGQDYGTLEEEVSERAAPETAMGRLLLGVLAAACLFSLWWL